MTNAQTTQTKANGVVLQDVASLEREIAALKAQLAAKPAGREIGFKVSEKTGVLSVTGLNKQFPVSLYASQWERFLTPANVAALHAFIVANDGGTGYTGDTDGKFTKLARK